MFRSSVLKRLRILFCGISIFTICELQAQVTPNRSASSALSHPTTSLSSSPSSSIPTTSVGPYVQTPIQTQARTPLPPPAIPSSMIPVSRTPVYVHPGALALLNGQWEGGDHLFNLTNNLGVRVDIVKPQSDTLSLTEDRLKQLVESSFSQRGISPVTLAAPDQPPLPFFHIQVLLYPISRGYVACCEGRLFESVALRRMTFDPGMAFQAITWEKDILLVSSNESIIAQIENAISQISQAFIERFQSSGVNTGLSPVSPMMGVPVR